MNKDKIIISLLSLISIIFLIYAFLNNSELFKNIVIFTFIGIGLAFLRLIINSFIKKTKGKPLYYKIIFFAILLSFGIPFQNWFRKNVILAMNPNLILPTVIYAIVIVLLTTIIIGLIIKKKGKNNII